MVGVAVNVTDVPAQMVVAEAAMETAGVTGVVIVILIELLLAVEVVTQLKELVIAHVTTSPLLKDE